MFLNGGDIFVFWFNKKICDICDLYFVVFFVSSEGDGYISNFFYIFGGWVALYDDLVLDVY